MTLITNDDDNNLLLTSLPQLKSNTITIKRNRRTGVPMATRDRTVTWQHVAPHGNWQHLPLVATGNTAATSQVPNRTSVHTHWQPQTYTRTHTYSYRKCTHRYCFLEKGHNSKRSFTFMCMKLIFHFRV